MGLGLLVTAAIVFDFGHTYLTWFGLGLVFSVGNLAYALLCSHFPVRLAGRANTALNLATFAGAFGLQWGFGALVDRLLGAGLVAKEAYQWSYGVLLALQVVSYAWFVIGGRISSRT
jgi:hypothetical protein